MNSQSICCAGPGETPAGPYLASISNMASRLARAYGHGIVSQKTHDQSARPFRRPWLADERH